MSERALAAAAHERRIGQKPVPDDLEARLSELQRLALKRLEAFGWKVLFVRRANLATPMVVVGGPRRRDVAVLTEDGQLDRSARITFR
jgi:hypothetical protein